MKNLSKKWKLLFSPFFVGLITTIGLYLFTIGYYDIDFDEPEDSINSLYKFFYRLNLESFNQRIQSRGPRKNFSKDLALITVDERSLDLIGRWPWPRDILAKGVDNAIKNGAKVIAFDAIFSEPTALPTLKIIENTPSLDPKSKELLKSEIFQKNPDNEFARSVYTNADKIVLGTFFGSNIPWMNNSFENVCLGLAFKGSKTFEVWDNEEAYLGVFDKLAVYIPDVISEYFQSAIQEMRNTYIENEKQNYDSSHLQQEVDRRITSYCLEKWLKPELDPDYTGRLADNWQEVLKADEDIKASSLEEWANKFASEYWANPVVSASDWVLNIDSLNSAKKHSGFFNAFQDLDGTIRRAYLVAHTGETYMPSVALKGFLVANNYNAEFQLVPNDRFKGYQYKKVSDFSITDLNQEAKKLFKLPVDEKGRLYINYAGPQKIFPYISFADLVKDGDTLFYEQRQWDGDKLTDVIKTTEVSKKEFLKDKILLFGATAIGIYDLRVTPFDKNYPGAETHLNVMDNIINQNAFHSLDWEYENMSFLVLLLGLLLSVAFTYLGALQGLLFTLASLFSTYLIDKYYFFNNEVIVTILFPLCTILGVYVSITVYKYFTEEKNKRELKGTFAKYVSPAIVDEVLSDPENIELGGKKIRMSVFFSDIRGFTTISEKLDPKQLSDLLNSYLTPMTDIVFKNKGTLDKYMGDAIMAFFGAPIQYSDHAAYACRCALDQLVKLKELQAEYKAKGLPMIDIGMGINTGEMSVGNMGSETVRSYTVMGDAVNLGSRLEGINKQYGTRIIISEFTYADVKDHFICREIDWVRVKGKLEPVKIYELIAENNTNDSMQTVLSHFNEGFKLYHEKQWQKAIQEFEQALSENPEDGPSLLYVERCKDYISHPPEGDWDGVFVMKTK
ncbi:MAG: CHASE2 domain-containing protein [Bdellovibrionales bacterium]|nr:CHASE2 domain-containing protein [Bdellovibrionales bacterium]